MKVIESKFKDKYFQYLNLKVNASEIFLYVLNNPKFSKWVIIFSKNKKQLQKFVEKIRNGDYTKPAK